MTKAEFVKRIAECGERSFYADDTITNVFKRNPMICGSWGMKDLVKVPSADYPEEDYGFMFKVSGLLFTGAVLVTLGFEDLFYVRFFEHIYGKDCEGGGSCLTERKDKQLSAVYVEDLIKLLDYSIETKEEQFS